MGEVSVRYIVSDVGSAVRFYTGMLGFHVDMQPAPGFARISKVRVIVVTHERVDALAGRSSR